MCRRHGIPRYAATAKLKFIRLLEESSLPVWRTLDQLGIPRSTFFCRKVAIAPAGLRVSRIARRHLQRVGENPQERTLEIQCLNCGAKSAAYYGCGRENVEMVEVAECGIREGSELQKECVHAPVHQPDSRSHRERR